MTNLELFNYVLSDEYWLTEAVEHFLSTADEERIECLEESYND